MKKSKVLMLIISVVVLVLEILPYGAVCNFANPDGNPIKNTYSYFDLTPFGYANFGPFITAALTCVLVVLSIVFFIKSSKKLSRTIRVISGVSFFTSILPIMYGISYISFIGVTISLLLLSYFVISILTNKTE